MGNIESYIIAIAFIGAIMTVILVGYAYHWNLALVFAAATSLGFLIDVGVQRFMKFRGQGTRTGKRTRS